MSQISLNTSSISFSSVTEGAGARSPQMALALLQMELAKSNKEEALTGIKEIENTQAQKAQWADMLNKARDAQSGEHYLNNWGDEDGIDANLKQFATENGINLPDQDKVGRPKQGDVADKDKIKSAWDNVIAQMQTKMDTIGADIQTKMVQLQDFMGQYNSYMQGANSAISSSNQVLTSLAQGR